APNLFGERFKLRLHIFKACEIARECVLGTNRLADTIGKDWPMIDATRNVIIMRARLPEMFLQEFQAVRPQIKGSENTKTIHLGGRCRANAVKPFHPEGFNESKPHRGRDDK